MAVADAHQGTACRRTRHEVETIILSQLGRANGPISAYDIADRATAAGDRVVPNQVYRTLARLIEEGRVHRIESMSAYVLKNSEIDACLICNHCYAVVTLSTPQLIEQLNQCANTCGFSVRRTIIETHGYCADCFASRP